MEIQLGYQLDDRQRRRVIDYLNRRPLQLLYLYFGLIALLGLTVLAFPGRVGRTMGWACLALAILCTIVVPRLIPVLALRGSLTTLSRLPLTVWLTDQVLSQRSQLHESTISWAAVRRVIELPDLWLVMLGPKTSVPLPKTAFNDAQQTRFRDFLIHRNFLAT